MKNKSTKSSKKSSKKGGKKPMIAPKYSSRLFPFTPSVPELRIGPNLNK